MGDVDNAIFDIVLTLVQRRSPEITEVTQNQSLVADLHLQSMDLAELVANLEIRLDDDPFAADVSIASIRTVGDLCRAYGRDKSRKYTSP